jgi:hypothetical protein
LFLLFDLRTGKLKFFGFLQDPVGTRMVALEYRRKLEGMRRESGSRF